MLCPVPKRPLAHVYVVGRSATVAHPPALKHLVWDWKHLCGSATVADRAVLKPNDLCSFPKLCSATVADRAVLKPPFSIIIVTYSSATVADRAVLKPTTMAAWQISRFSNRGRSSGSQTERSGIGIQTAVQQPWQIERFSNLWVWICRLNWAFLFQRTAKSARSSCFCDPPGRFFDRAIGSPQA